ncbi:cytochrome P450 [Xanthobacter sp. V4C-4]|uniref:cytochrome P450 n=1 Tax=Xanthobacter cornucopiae TaxID=3119924 RepID=UPI003728965C
MTDKGPQVPGFCALAPNQMDDPAAFYATLRAAPPVFWSPADTSWIVHRQAEARAVLGDRSFRVAELSAIVAGVATRGGKAAPTLTSLLSVFLPFINPPEHAAARRYIHAVLEPGRVPEHAPAIAAIAAGLLADIPPGQAFDGAAHYADLLPSLVMGHLLGLPGAMVMDFVLASAEMGRAFDRGGSPRYYARMEALITRLRAPFQAAVDARRQALDANGPGPAMDGLTRMIVLADSLRPMPDSAIADHAMFLIMAGSENTSALIGSTLAATLEAGLDLGRLATDPDWCLAVVEETLRHDGPVLHLWRFATRDLELGGASIPAGDRLLLLAGAANRDPLAFPDPDRFDPGRTDRHGIGLSIGMHYCLGGDLAMLESRIALQTLAARRPRLDPGHTTAWRDRQTLRRLSRLPLRLDTKDPPDALADPQA